MATVLKIASGILAVAFLLVGVSWWIAPEFASSQLGMDVLSGVALSTQIGDLASFFLTLGACVAMGLAKGERLWFAPALMLLGFAVLGRFIAWMFYAAALPVHMIAVEAVSIVVLALTAQSLATRGR